MNITLAQLNPKIGDFEHNLGKAELALEQAHGEGSDLLILPELFLMGYPPQDLLEKKWFNQKQTQALKRLAETTRRFPEIGVVVGAAISSELSPGRGLYNAAVLFFQGRLVSFQAKSLLPTYDVFDEARYFDPADIVEPVPFKNTTLGLNVCEDAWNEPELWPDRLLYARNPIEVLGRKKAGLLINCSASPFALGKDRLRFRMVQGHATKEGIPFVFVNQVGGNDELIFDGSSLCLDARGRVLFRAPSFEECVRTVDLDGPPDPNPFEPLDEVESVVKALTLGLKDYLGKSGFQKALVGLSGGIDSAVTFALAVEALGPEKVLGISMPSMYSSPGSVDDSRILAENLGAEFRVVPITSTYEAYLGELAPHFSGLAPDVTEENLQARIRGNILMAFSNKFGHLVLSTGNKSELAMGYCTLYGDMSGGLAVISDLPKTMVYQAARFINRNREIIPQAILDKAPSAELRPDQKDEDSLPPYPVLDGILNLYVEQGFSGPEIVARGYDPDIVRFVILTVNRNEYKRKQAAPGLKVTSKAFGVGRRMPIVAQHDSPF